MVHFDRFELLSRFAQGLPIHVKTNGIGLQISMTIDAIQREDGSGFSFILTGHDVRDTERVVRVYVNTRTGQSHVL